MPKVTVHQHPLSKKNTACLKWFFFSRAWATIKRMSTGGEKYSIKPSAGMPALTICLNRAKPQ
jgi:transposase